MPAGRSEKRDPVRCDESDWFRHAFDEVYLHLYAHRDESEAARLIATLIRQFPFAGPVLDVACGPGRFVRCLDRDGWRVTGLDLSWPLLRTARAALRRDQPPLVRADMRRLPIKSASQGWALLLFTSFGYFALVREDQEVLDEIARVLRPGGFVALDFLNDVQVRRTLVPESRRRVQDHEVHEIRLLDPEGPFLRKRVRVSASYGGRPDVLYEERVRLYTPSELRSLLAAAGLATRTILGDYDGASFDPESSPRCLLIAQREGD